MNGTDSEERPAKVLLEVEGKVPLTVISRAQISGELSRLKAGSKHSYAVMWIMDSTGRYYQCAGDGGGMLLEKRTSDGRMWRAWTVRDRTTTLRAHIEFSAGSIELSPEEWIRRSRVIEMMWSVASIGREPDGIEWREITHLLA